MSKFSNQISQALETLFYFNCVTPTCAYRFTPEWKYLQIVNYLVNRLTLGQDIIRAWTNGGEGPQEGLPLLSGVEEMGVQRGLDSGPGEAWSLLNP